ncbi:MAG TPA: hypothetical protein VLD83_11115 [Candidatus Binatia bacterium]|nr:hypothetical protein [Candidatus Binatia bacterium]
MSRLGRIPKRVLLFSYLMIALAAPPTGAAENQSQAVRVKIGTILASNQNDEIDPKLNAMKNQLKVMKYRSYRLLKEETQDVPWQGNAAFEIPGGRSLVVTPQEFRNKQLALKVRLQQGNKPVVDTTVRLNNGGNFLLGGPPHEGGALVLSISATAQ